MTKTAVVLLKVYLGDVSEGDISACWFSCAVRFDSDNLFGLNFQPLFHDKFIFTVDGC